MEKTKTLLFMLPAVALFLFVACSGENDLTAETPTAQQKETPSNAIGFDAYLNRTTTRAGWAGELNLTNLRSTGFGVFAYYGDGDLYSENLVPNFMYNQHVTYAISTDKWTYEPVKYWPNEFGSSAVSTSVDRVSFFAYAPYVAVEPSSGLLTSDYDGTTTEKLTETGITWLSRNGKGGDPYVRYVTSFESAKCVDLCYGLAAENFTSSVDGGDGINNVKKGQPYLNVAKPTTDSRIKFDFKHALAKLKVQVDADVDVASHSNGGDPDVVGGMTRVWVRSITFEGVSQRGFLNMRTGTWHEVMDGKKISHATVTVYDGRRDGSEAISDDTYEEITGFNSALVQSGVYTTDVATGTTFPYTTFTSTTTGVTEEYKDLFDGTGELMVIPANEQLKVTIVYDVETADATLPNYLSDGKTKGSTIENKITKAITLGGNPLKLESGNAYTINLHLGLNSVKFDATVSDWDAGNGSETDLPANVNVYESVSGTPEATEITIPYSPFTYTYTFGVSGFNAHEPVTADAGTGSNPVSSPVVANGMANLGGIAIVTVTFNENDEVTNDTKDDVIITGGSSGKKFKVKFIQKAAPLGLSVADNSQKMSGETEIVLSTKRTSSPWSNVGTVTNDATSSIFVYKNGALLTYKATPTSATEFNWVSANNKIVLGGAATAGDVFTITVKAGNADAETYSFTVKKKDGTLNAFSNTAVNYSIASYTDASTAAHTQTTTVGAGEDGTITYSIARTTGSGAEASVDSDGKVYFKVSPTKDDVYTVTATVADGANYTYAEKTKTYTITITD